MARAETSIRKFNERWKLDPVTGCWIWTSFIAPDGYGKMMAFGEQYAHRVSYKIHHGELSSNECVMHACDNPSCVNPSHLVNGSHADNMHDMAMKHRSMCGEKHKDSKLTEIAVIKLRTVKSSLTDICQIFNVAEITAKQAQRGVTWKYLNDAVKPL